MARAARRERPFPAVTQLSQTSASGALAYDQLAPINKLVNILILCTGNSARSILAEAIINHDGAGRFRAYSAGSHPKGQPNPLSLALLRDRGIDTQGLRAKSWDEFAAPGAPKMDIVITVCDAAAGETCPYWPGTPVVAHWGIPDPAADQGSPEKNRAAFELAFQRLSARVAALLTLPVETMPAAVLKAHLAEIGRLDGATDMAKAAIID
jgi:arsenate reductase